MGDLFSADEKKRAIPKILIKCNFFHERIETSVNCLGILHKRVSKQKLQYLCKGFLPETANRTWDRELLRRRRRSEKIIAIKFGVHQREILQLLINRRHCYTSQRWHLRRHNGCISPIGYRVLSPWIQILLS